MRGGWEAAGVRRNMNKKLLASALTALCALSTLTRPSPAAETPTLETGDIIEALAKRLGDPRYDARERAMEAPVSYTHLTLPTN